MIGDSHKQELPYRILVIRRRYLGDLILLGPALRNLRLHAPRAWITVVVDDAYRDVLSRNHDVNEVLGLPLRHGRNQSGYLRRWYEFIRQLRRQRFDLAFDLTANNRSAFVTGLCKADCRVSYLAGKRMLRHRVYDLLVPWGKTEWRTGHILDFFLAPLQVLGVPIVTRTLTMEVDANDMEFAQRLLNTLLPADDCQLVMVHPGSRIANKCWPPENFAAVCDAVTDRFGAHVLILGGTKDDPVVSALLAASQTKPATLLEQITVPQLAALLKRATVYLGNDSGPMHVATAVGTPVVALFGGQPLSMCRPIGDAHIALRPPDCSPSLPCLYPGICRPPNGEAMLCVCRITVGEVVGAVEKQLAEAQRLKQGGREVTHGK